MKSSTSTKSQKKSKETPKEPEENVLENFKVCIQDFTADLSITFPEFDYQWKQWQHPELPVSEWEKLLDYCKKVYPERFFDLLYKNEDIFALPSAEGDVKIEDVDSDEEEEEGDVEKREVNVFFLPNVDFRKLYHCQGVTENTKESIWKYLQMILFLIMKTVNHSAAFGESEDLFAGVDEKD